MSFDVNAARAQRLEATGSFYEFTLDGESFLIPFELDVKQLDKMRAAQTVVDVFDVLLGEDQAEARKSHELTLQDIKAIMQDYGQTGGVTVGEDSSSSN